MDYYSTRHTAKGKQILDYRATWQKGKGKRHRVGVWTDLCFGVWGGDGEQMRGSVYRVVGKVLVLQCLRRTTHTTQGSLNKPYILGNMPRSLSVKYSS